MSPLRRRGRQVTRTGERAVSVAAAALVTVALQGCGPGRGAAGAEPGEPSFWDYQVRVGPDAALDVTATFHGPRPTALELDERALPFVRDVQVGTPRGFRPTDFRSASFRDACGSPCRIRYRLALGALATRLAEVETAWASGGAVFAPPSTWLLRPLGVTSGRYRFHVETLAPATFVTGVRRAPDGAPGTYEADIASLGEAAFSGLGALRVVPVGGSKVVAAIASGVTLSDDVVARWLGAELSAVTAYFGRVPDDPLAFFVAPGTSEVTRGETLGGGGASVLVRLGTKVTEATLGDDWVVAHELVHVASPDVGYEHAWFSEGLATYAEPLLRVRAGLLAEEKMWGDLVEGLPQGFPGKGDTGLEGSHEWGRVYWGGALFFLLADLRIRQETAGARSLESALRSIAASGASVEQRWPLERVLSEADRATGTRVLHDLYARLGTSPGTADLDALWKRLGVEKKPEGGVRLDDSAPDSRVRRALTARETSGRAHDR